MALFVAGGGAASRVSGLSKGPAGMIHVSLVRFEWVTDIPPDSTTKIGSGSFAMVWLVRFSK